MAAMASIDAIEWLRKQIEETAPDPMKAMLTTMVGALMSAEVDAVCGAGYGERSGERENSRNGYRSRPWDTRVGSIDLQIPKLRHGTYFPTWLLEPRRRAEKALTAVVAEAYALGVSTRKVEDLVQALGIEKLSKSQVSQLAKELDAGVKSFRERPLTGQFKYLWLDALVIKCREGGRIVNVACLVGVGVNEDGRREILGLDVVTGEDGAGWLAFLRGLRARGLKGVELVISDAHSGLKDAIASVLRGAAWQRCRTHFVRNMLTRVPKAAHAIVASYVRTIFMQADAESVREQHARTVEQLRTRFPKAAAMLADVAEELLAFTAFPKEHWRQIWSNNPQERLNREIRRRTDVVGIFPNRDSIIRLVGAVLCEIHDDWAVVRRYMTINREEVEEEQKALKPALKKHAA
ncbi:MAG: IS256 family transposase [Desulfuromonadales bacterium]|nr:MAG: IS256 family transposase [Desulfuromonadales bacterium]